MVLAIFSVQIVLMQQLLPNILLNAWNEQFLLPCLESFSYPVDKLNLVWSFCFAAKVKFSDATKNLNEMNKIPGNPWKLSFSYSRAIQASVLDAWKVVFS